MVAWRGWRFKNYLLSFFGFGYDASKDHSCIGYCNDLDCTKNVILHILKHIMPIKQ